MMGRSPYRDDKGLKKGPWTPDEDRKLVEFIQQHGHGSWRALPKLAGLNRCGKSCRLRWTNYLRPDIKRGKFSEDEEQTIINLHSLLGNKWSAIASHLQGRTDNEIKNFWNTHLKKKLLNMGIDPVTHKPRTDLNLLANLPQLLLAAANLLTTTPTTSPPILLNHHMLMNPPSSSDNNLSLQYPDHQLAKNHILHNILQALTANYGNTSASTSSPSTNLPSVAHDHRDNNYNTADIITNTTATTTTPPNLPGPIMPFHHQNHQLQYDDPFPCSNFSNFEPPRPSQRNMNAHFNNKDTGMMMMPPPDSSNNTINPQQQNTTNQHRQTTLITQPIAANNNISSSNAPVPLTCSTIAFGTCDDQMPSLVSASPDQQRMKLQMDDSKFNTNLNYDENISNPSSTTTTTTFDAWNEIIDDEASTSYWKNIIQQASSPSWPISSYIHNEATRHFGS